MPRVEMVPGRRKAMPPRPARTSEEPARARAPRDATRPAGDEQPPPPSGGARGGAALGALWLVALLASTGGLVAARFVRVDLRVEQSLAVTLGVLLAIGLTVRSGGRGLPAGLLAALLGAGAVVTQSPTLLAGAAVATGVLAACLAVLATTPARSFPRASLEVVLAQAIASAGALAVAGLAVDMDPQRFRYTVLGLSLAVAVALVHRLGGGLRGLGARGAVLVGAALLLLVVVLAYSAALTHWGSPGLRADLDAARTWTHDQLGAVPRPLEVLLGVPALAWGVTMRDRRRQGWWVCAFGTVATATAATRLVVEDASLSTLLGAVYGVVLGLLVGFVVIRLARLLRGSPGRRAARLEVAHRPEPPRLHPLH